MKPILHETISRNFKMSQTNMNSFKRNLDGDKNDTSDDVPSKIFKIDKNNVENFSDKSSQSLTTMNEAQVISKIYENMNTSIEQPDKNNKSRFQWNLVFDVSVFDLMLQHLTEDVLKLSLVSKNFNELLGKSKWFKSKMQVKLVDIPHIYKHLRRQDLDLVMKNSTRNYKHLTIRASEAGFEEMGMLYKNDWQTAVLSITEFESTVKFVKYLGLMLPTLSKLQLSVKTIQKICLESKLEFSSLKQLVISECTSNALEPFAKDEINESLTALTLTAVRQSSGINLCRIVYNFLEKFHCLTYLDVGSSVADIVFRDTAAVGAKFKLKELRVETPTSLQACENVEAFIKSQGKSLTEICLLLWKISDTLYNIIGSMKQLVVFQMSNKRMSLMFEEKNFLVLPNKLKTLILDFPLSDISKTYIQGLVFGKRFTRIEINFKIDFKQLDDIKELLRNATRDASVNGCPLSENEPFEPNKLYNVASSSDCETLEDSNRDFDSSSGDLEVVVTVDEDKFKDEIIDLLDSD